MNRREALGAIIAAPWVVRQGVCMPIRPLVMASDIADIDWLNAELQREMLRLLTGSTEVHPNARTAVMPMVEKGFEVTGRGIAAGSIVTWTSYPETSDEVIIKRLHAPNMVLSVGRNFMLEFSKLCGKA